MRDDIATEGAEQGAHRISLRLEATGSHTTMTMWVNGANAGALCVRNDEADILLTITQALREGGTLRGISAEANDAD